MLSSNILTSVTWECVHFIDKAQQQQSLGNRLDGTGVYVCEVDGAMVGNKQQLLSAVAGAMKFPDYFGKNWDALDECLRDMEWLPAKGYVLIFNDAKQFWRDQGPLGGKLIESWLFAAENWAIKKIPFHLVFVW